MLNSWSEWTLRSWGYFQVNSTWVTSSNHPNLSSIVLLFQNMQTKPIISTRLTLKLFMQFTDKYMLGRSISPWTNTGFCRWRERTIVSSISAGAEAVNAMTGTSVNALKLPIFSKEVLKSFPLFQNYFYVTSTNRQYYHNYAHMHARRKCMYNVTTDHSAIQWASSTATMESLSLNTLFDRTFFQAGNSRISGDRNTTKGFVHTCLQNDHYCQ